MKTSMWNVLVYYIIPRDEYLTSLKRFFNWQTVNAGTLIEPVALVLKNDSFDFFEKTYKQIFGRAIGTKFVPS